MATLFVWTRKPLVEWYAFLTKKAFLINCYHFWGAGGAGRVPLLLLFLSPLFPIILFLPTTLSTGMTGNSLHWANLPDWWGAWNRSGPDPSARARRSTSRSPSRTPSRRWSRWPAENTSFRIPPEDGGPFLTSPRMATLTPGAKLSPGAVKLSVRPYILLSSRVFTPGGEWSGELSP
jgi:hypothetical protein